MHNFQASIQIGWDVGSYHCVSALQPLENSWILPVSANWKFVTPIKNEISTLVFQFW